MYGNIRKNIPEKPRVTIWQLTNLKRCDVYNPE